MTSKFVYKDYLHIYTNASKTAAAFFVPELNVESSARLWDGLSIFSAELIAIKMSLQWVLEFSSKYELVNNIAIFSDSLSSLTAIKTGKCLCRPNTVNEIYDLVDSIFVGVKLIWIPSHVGIPGNETADRLAQSAVSNNAPYIDTCFELNEFYRNVNGKLCGNLVVYW